MKPFTGERTFLVGTMILISLSAGAAMGCAKSGDPQRNDGEVARERSPLSSGIRAAKAQIRKHVTEKASFVLYLPDGWRCAEKAEDGLLSLTIEDADGRFGAEVDYGPGGQAGEAQARLVVARLARRWPDLRLANTLRSADHSRIVFDGYYEEAKTGPREFRCWVTADAANTMSTRIEGPAGNLAANKAMLLSVLANVRLIKGAFQAGEAALAPLVTHRLGDSSASFGLPQGWKFQDLGKTQFIAFDPQGRFSFMVAKAEMISPQMGLNAPGMLVLPYMSPHEALQNLTAKLGIATNMKFLWIQRIEEREKAAAQGGASMAIEAFLYTCDGKIGPSKGFTFGMCNYSRVGTWSLIHFTVAGPESEFDAFSPNLANMLQSYQVNQAWINNYVRRGLANLRRLQQQTAQIVSRNAQEIRSMMQAAYQERQTSQGYIDYQRTNYIRGQQDWISSVEGGAVYHSDTWGLTNTATGEFYKGQPYDYVHFQGENPKYRETMTPIDSRELWERNIKD